jgi:uncharacterized membrane protein
MKKIFFTLAIISIFILNSSVAFAAGLSQKTVCDNDNGKIILPSEIGVVQSVDTYGDATNSTTGEFKEAKQSVKVKIIRGKHKGQDIFVDNMLMGNPAFDIKLKKGDRVVLHVEQAADNINYFIEDRERVGGLYFLSGLFIFLLIFVGRKKGLFSLISIFVTLSLIFGVMTPMILHGINPIFSTVLTCLLAALFAIYIVGGINHKSTAAVLGTTLSLVFAGFLSMLVIKLSSLTGFTTEESMYLFSAHPNLNFVGVLASSMIIGALGAVMDIGMSIASTVNELYQSNKSMTIYELFQSGMNVGRDIIGTMANTLILAYLGGSMALVLLASNLDVQKFFNLNQVATEISSALVGSVSLVVCVPLTAIIAAYLIKRKNIAKKEDSDQSKTESQDLEENGFSDIM